MGCMTSSNETGKRDRILNLDNRRAAKTKKSLLSSHLIFHGQSITWF